MPRVKLLTSNVYSPTNPSSEVAIRGQIDGSIAEVYDAFTATTGSAIVGHDSPNIAATNTKDAIEEVYAAISSTVLGEIPDNSFLNVKLASDIKVGSLATLTTTEKSSVVGAINEIDAYVNGVPEQADTIETDLNILRTAKVTTGSNVALAVDTDGTFDMTRNGNTLTVIPNVANTGAMTIAVDGQTARAIQKANDVGTLVALEAGDIKQNVPVQLVLQTSGTPVFIYAPKGGTSIKSIQEFYVNVPIAHANIACSTVDLNKSVLFGSFFIGISNVQRIPVWKIVDNTNISIRNYGGTGTQANLRLVEFNNVKSKQVVSITTTANLYQLISSVNPLKCILVLSFSGVATSTDFTTGTGRVFFNPAEFDRILVNFGGTLNREIEVQILEFE